MEMENLIKAVRDHANANWGKDGWDFLVECWGDEDIGHRHWQCQDAQGCYCRLQAGCKNDGRTSQRDDGDVQLVTFR
jgi:hypothetical protein